MIWLRLLLLAAIAAPVHADVVTEDRLDREVWDIAKDLRCAVCQNQPVSESNADLARDMRALIRAQLVAGKSRQEIVDYFVARYGDYVLLKPPHRGAGSVLWALPWLILAVLGVGAFVYQRRRLGAPLPPAAPLSPEDRERVNAARRPTDER